MYTKINEFVKSTIFNISESITIEGDDSFQNSIEQKIELLEKIFPNAKITTKNYDLFFKSSEQALIDAIKNKEIDIEDIRSAIETGVDKIFNNFAIYCRFNSDIANVIATKGDNEINFQLINNIKL